MNYWWILALMASIGWGLHYTLIGNAIKYISPFTIILVTSLVQFSVALIFKPNTVKNDILYITTLGFDELKYILPIAVLPTVSLLLIMFSFEMKNTTVATLLEILYPLWIVLFSYILFNSVHVNTSVFIGGLLIFSGVLTIVWFN